MELIVGLGNPGKRYEKTRHNVGFMVVDYPIGKISVSPHAKRKLLSLIYYWYEEQAVLAKPTVFMNNSGQAVRRLMHHFNVRPPDLLIVHDDLDVALGEYKLQKGRGAAGHHGVESVIAELRSKDFWRLRVGIGHSKDATDPEDYVLRDFTPEELAVLGDLIHKKLIPEIRSWLSTS